MGFDGIVLTAVVKELRDKLQNGRIDKIQQPTRDDLLLTVRANRANYRWLLSANKAHPRMYLSTQFNLPNPGQAPMFCMLMRKHLEGGRIKDIRQIGRERIVAIDVEAHNELGDLVTRCLMIEIMGKHSNIILLTEPDGTIIDATNHTPASVNRHREVLPGRPYVYPPAQHKEDPFTERREGFLAKRSQEPQLALGRFLVNHYAGVSPFFGKEAEHAADLEEARTPAAEWVCVEALFQAAQHAEKPTIVMDEEGQPVEFYVFPPRHLAGQNATYTEISEMLDTFYVERALADIARSKASSYLRLARTELERDRNKISKLSDQLAAGAEADLWRVQGELLLAHLHELQKGQTEVTLPNFYDDDRPLTISLHPAKTPLENANAFFRRYQKYQKGRHITEEQLQIAKTDAAYWESVVHELEATSLQSLPLIEAELRETGLLKHRLDNKEGKQKPPSASYAEFRASDGTPILVGRNNKENDHLTFKVAKKSDLWLHVKDAPGSHVILRNSSPSDETLYEAALIAAYFSRFRDATKAPVDVVPVKDLWKPNGAKPGFVLFTGQKTLMVALDADKLRTLLQSPLL